VIKKRMKGVRILAPILCTRQMTARREGEVKAGRKDNTSKFGMGKMLAIVVGEVS